jgi:hypothetical protein
MLSTKGCWKLETATWPGSRLVEIWNTLPGVTPVKKFADRRKAVARIWKAIQSLGPMVGIPGRTAILRPAGQPQEQRVFRDCLQFPSRVRNARARVAAPLLSVLRGLPRELRQSNSRAGPHGGAGRTGSPREAPDRLPQPNLSGNRNVPGRPGSFGVSNSEVKSVPE